MRSGGPAGDDSVEPGCSGERRKRREHQNRSISKQPLLWEQSEPAKRGGWDRPKRTYRTRVDPTLECCPLCCRG